MPKVHSKPLRKTLEVDRIIGHIKGSGSGPTLIFTGGIHGNESSGVFALHTVYEAIKKNGLPINGSFYALSGNLWALEREKRYHKQDLNRLWTTDNVNLLRDGNLIPENEDLAQQMEIYKTLSNIMENESGPFYFMDLHTTSSQTIPFLTVNDSLLNRKFCEQYPIPMILGIEEYLDGPLLNWVNDLGYVAFGYEAGQHDSLSSIENHIAFIYLSMVFTGCLEKSDIDFDHYFQVLEKTAMNFRHVYEIFYRYQINEKEEFNMKPGFLNFQEIHKGQELAISNGRAIKAQTNARIFMPIYQNQGDDGFFTIRRIPHFFLWLSSYMRKWRFDRILPYLPGIKWSSGKRDKLLVNLKLARLLARRVFHLMGYRSKFIHESQLVAKNREAAARYSEYEGENWYKNAS